MGRRWVRSLREYRAWYGLRGVVLAAKSRWWRPQAITRVTPPGIAHPVVLRTLSTDTTVYQQVFICAQYAYDLAREPAVIVDAGANVGFTAVYFANRYPRAAILALEPEPANFALLERNASPYPAIVPVRAALWNELAEVRVADPGHGFWGYQIRAPGRNAAMEIGRARGVTVDRLMEEYGLDRIDLLKMDIEGAEREVFGSPSRWIAKVGVLIVEVHERLHPGTARRVHAAAAGFDFVTYRGEHVCYAREEFVPSQRSLAAYAVAGGSHAGAQAPTGIWMRPSAR